MQGLRCLAALTLLAICFQESYSLQDRGSSLRRSRRMLFPNAAGAKSGDDGGCKDYAIVCARGTGELQTGSFAYAGLVSDILKAVPKGKKYEIVYPASVDYFTGPGQGAADGMKYIASQVTSCPKQKYVLVGYSEGAMVVTQMMSKPELPAELLVAAVLLGNPHHTSNAPQNQCSGKIGNGVAAMMAVKVPQTSVTKIFDCCLAGDAICAPGTGTGAAHLNYPMSPFMKTAAQFVIARLKGNSLAGSSAGPAATSSEKKGQNTLVTGNLRGSTPPSTVESSKAGFPGLAGLTGGLPGFSGLSGFGLPSADGSGQAPQGGTSMPKFNMPNFGGMGLGGFGGLTG